MKTPHSKTGFTIIEVALFLALSGLLMIGLIVGANTSISRQRYNDSVNNVGDYIRNIYADALNVSNDKTVTPDTSTYTGPGRTTTAVYGKLVTFGEKTSSVNNTITSTIYSYDVVGRAITSAEATSQSVLNMLKTTIDASIADTVYASGLYTNNFYRLTSYNIPWEAKAQEPNTAAGTPRSSIFSGAVLVVRSPTTGSLRTYVYSGSMANFSFHTIDDGAPSGTNVTTMFRQLLDNLHEGELNFCVESSDNNYGNRRNIRILERAGNSTGVLLVALDGEDSKCLGRP